LALFDVLSPIRTDHFTKITEELVILVDFARPKAPR